MKTLPEEIELYRDKKWRRDESLLIDKATQIEEMVQDLGFLLTLTDSRTNFPSVYIGVCGRRDVHTPKNVQKDYETSLAWTLKDEVMMHGKVFYGKLAKGRSMFVAPHLIKYFHSIYGDENLSDDAQKVLKILRTDREMATSDLREETKIADRKSLTKAIEELQRKMYVVPSEVLYKPKFTYIWTLTEERFPAEMSEKIDRETALREIARQFLKINGQTMLGDLAKFTGLKRKECGKANHELVDEGFAVRLETGIYRLKTLV
jgi:Winged helix DNA-binding domain